MVLGHLADCEASTECIQSSLAKTRIKGFQDLRYILRHNQNSSKVSGLDDASFHSIFETLFHAAVGEQSQVAKAKTSATQRSASGRLSELASALRHAVDVGAPFIKAKTARAVLDHVADTIQLPNGSFCEPIAVDYAKCMRTILSHQPHVEHMNRSSTKDRNDNEWERIADFCARCIQEVTAQSGADEFPAENGLTSTAGHANTSSYRSSRSAHRDSGGSQVHSSAVRTVVDEMIGCLRALTAAPNAPLQKKAEPLLWLLIEYLRTTIPTPRSPDDAFAAVNQLLCWTRTEDTKLTQDITVRLVRLVKDYWTAKSPALNQMTITILLLRPYIFHAMSQDEGVALRAELSGLLQAIQGEYSQRQDREQAKQLSLEDIRLEINVTRSLEDGKVGIPLFTLQPSEARSNSESSWALTYILASLTAALMGADKLDHELDSSHDDREANGQRPSKRRRRDFDDQSEDFAVLLKGTTSGSTQARICSLQTLAFLAQQRALDTVEIGRTIDALMVSCADDVSAVASWAYLAFASCASQTSATSPKLTSKWTSLWQLASRALSNVNLCRSASFALFIMLRLRLVAHSSINDLVQIATNAMDLNGPAQISDAVTLLLRSVLNYSRQTNPEASSATAESILTWLSRTFTPSKLDDKQYTAGTVAYEVSDLVPLIDTVLNRQGHTLTSSNFPVWHIVARAWLFCEGQRELISYLLLNDEVDPRTNAALDEPMQQTAAAAPEVTRTSCEAILLTHLLAELTRANEAWATLVTERTRQPSHDTFAMLCKACCIVVCISSCVEFRDSRRSLQVRTQSENLLRSLGEYIARPESEQTKVDRFLTTFSAVFSGLARLGALCEYHRLPCEVLVCHAISKTLDTRQEATQFGDHNDPMELDDDLEDSQDSRQPSPAVDTSQLANDLDVAYSKLALRSSAALYATTIVALETRDEAMSDRSPASEQVVGFLLKQPETAVIASRSIITQFNRLGLVLALPDVQHLLEFFVDTIFPSYTYGRSEVAIGTFLDVMHCLIDTWTDPSNTDLHNLGLDVYDWCTATALPNGVLSPIVQKRLATLLVQLCRLLVDYPSSDGDASYAQDSSARTSLFILLKQGAVTVQFHLAESITKVFGRTVLSKHEPMFQDLVESLPEDIDKVEGIAMRLLFFAKLGSEWHSLLRQCVYYIFETAGTGSVSHAAHCIEVLASQLPLQTPRKLFTLFAPQLLFTWLSSDKSLREIPFAAFQYNSLNELLVENQTEVCAQVIMLGSEDGINMLSKALKVLPKGVITHSFAKSVAYAISCDIKTASTKGFTGDSVAVEHRLRSLIGGEVEHRDNIRKLWPAIIGYFFLTTQQEDAEDKWLETKPPEKQNYEPDSAVMLSALKKIKAFSHSKRRLPQSQEPSFRTSDLGREVGRLCKRLKFELGTLWDSSSFTLVVRMLLDAMDESLGSLHSCLMIRRLRILVCMAGEVAFRGFPLEMLIHSLRPFLNDSECADDALGVVQYLFNNSREHFRKHMPFLCGTVTLLVLQLRKYAKSSHNSTTQESQHSATVQKMLGFQKWLVEYLSKRASDCDSTAYQDLVKALSSLQLPGNARRDSPESALLLFLLTQWSAKEPLCTRTDCLEAIGMLAEGFESTTFIGEDCLGKDADAALYFQSLWDVMLQAPLPLGFTQWSARVVGRAYASTGQRPHNAPEQKHISSERYSHVVQDGQVTANSQAIIARRWVGLLLSRSRTEAGLAEHSLRKLDESPDQSATDTSVFAQALPCEVNDAVSSGCYSYEPLSASQRDFTAVDDDALRSALQIPAARSLEVWTRELAVTVCRWASSVAIVGCLGPLMRNVSSLSAELLPSMLHILLVEEMNRHRTLRFELSAAITACLADTDPALQDKQQFLLNLVLYLRSQPYPGESTRADRVQWLEVDYALAASAAARCGMPHCGLLLAESIIPVGQSRRASGRASLSQAQPVSAFENGLLLSLFRQMEEPDSFYGIQQPASLDTVLSRLDHEANGLRSLMFRSAQTDSRMRHSHRLAEEDAVGMIHSLSKLNFNSLAFALLNHGMGSGPKTSESMLDAAKALQQWDIDLPETRIGDAFTSFGILQELNRAADPRRVHEALCLAVAEHAQRGTFTGKSTRPSLSWCGVLASLTELEAIVSSSDLEEMATRWQAIQDGSSWMHMARYEDVRALLSNRETLFGVLSQNLELQRALHMGQRDARKFEVQALLEKSKLARGHGRLQEALTATATLSELIVLCSDNDLKVEGVVKLETATVLWDAGEASTSVKMLRDVLEMTDLGKQDLLVGRAGLRAQLAHQLAEARLEKPEDILRQYLKPAISELKTVKTGAEAGKVFFEFAKFCDDELQNPGNIENFNRVVKLRHGKQEEVDAIKAAIDKARRNGTDRSDLHRTLGQETKWLDMDTTEEKRLRDSRSVYVQQSLQNYLLALQASDEHDICVLRFFALWLEHSDDDRANSVVQKYLKDVPSWKFVLLMNQLMSRVSNEPSIFQAALGELMVRIFKQHPYHSLHHLFTNAKNQPKSNDPATRSRYLGSLAFVERLNRNPTRKDAIYRLFACNRLYRELADSTPEPNKAGRFKLDDIPAAKKLRALVSKTLQPPITISLPLRSDGNYDNVPLVQRFEDNGLILGGVSAPKLIAVIDDTGKKYKQIFKNGRDDLRQDAIMEQVFEEVSKMLRNHKSTRQRDLKVRTYKVIPLSNTTGVIEFVPNSMPLMDFLRPAHLRYHPKDIKENKAREIINGVKDAPQRERVAQYRKVCEQMQPVLRHFFLERYDNPDEWFTKRTAYTRTTASVSILGHIIGLGDRHCSNILIDEMTGEIVHIDLGVSFEAGKVLPIPELVPFRLTRDIIDGMGITKTEGVFRRCCEFTLDAVREDKDSIMTLLNVLRYDPLYNWTVSPLKAKRMQQAQDTGRHAADEIEPSTSKRNEDGGESERSLQIVEKKLSKTLSTAATVNELIQQATDESHLACLFSGWGAYY
jgi:ataxia telangiectasia mutated family protein